MVTLGLVVLAVLLLNPFNFWMPSIVVMCILPIILGLFALFSSFVLRENKCDEREERHRALAGRNSFLAGAGLLTLGIVVQAYTHTVDPWLVIALTVMILVKIATRMWTDKNL